eukprot:scaffold46251_cov52-Phaeocystis_antarctica.AAC.1
MMPSNEGILRRHHARGECAHGEGRGPPLALRCVAALASSTTQSVARHQPTASSASTKEITGPHPEMPMDGERPPGQLVR